LQHIPSTRWRDNEREQQETKAVDYAKTPVGTASPSKRAERSASCDRTELTRPGIKVWRNSSNNLRERNHFFRRFLSIAGLVKKNIRRWKDRRKRKAFVSNGFAFLSLNSSGNV
jgi:hypothetical protein